MPDRSSIAPKNNSIQPGSWLGVFGGGQLGRMFTHAAQRMGFHVAVWEPEANCPASQAADLHLQPASPDEDSQRSDKIDEESRLRQGRGQRSRRRSAA